MAKPNQIITHAMTGSGRTAVHTFTFKHGNTDLSDRTLTLDVSKIHASIIDAVINERMKAKVVDAAALPNDKTTGLPPPASVKCDNSATVIDRLMTGDADAWNAKRTRVEQVDPGIWLQRALVSLFPKRSAADWQATVVGWDKKTRDAMSARQDVRDRIAELQRAETADIDTDALLADLI